MILRRLYEDGLAQATYILACERTKTAVVVDPNRDIDRVLAAASEARVKIAAITETHIHADYVSGARDLARRSGARLLLSAHGGPDWSYRQVPDAPHEPLHDGDVIEIGAVRLIAKHTPGHTPEHLTFLVIDSATAPEPVGALTGDFIFVGDVGRPDLLERAAGVANTMESSARTLFRSLRDFEKLPDWLQLWPGHGAGSACGKSLGAMPQSTLGFERRFNPALVISDEEDFVREILSGQPTPPKYFAKMKQWNRDGAPAMDHMPQPRALPASSSQPVEGILLDVRDIKSFAAEHLADSINVPFNRSFIAYGGQVIPDGPITLLLPRHDAFLAGEVTRALALIGHDEVLGWLPPDVLGHWRATGATMGSSERTTAAATGGIPSGAILVDVRQPSEYAEGHVPDAKAIPLAQISARVHELPHDQPIYVTCQGGSRSAIAASVIRAAGYSDVVEISDGMDGWRRAGLPIERGDTAAASAVTG